MRLLSVNNAIARLGAKTLLQAVNLQLDSGEVMALIGPNGAGKTSLLQAISGSLSLQEGHVLLADCAMDQYAPATRARSVAVLPQYNHLDFDYTVEEVVSLGRIPHKSGQKVDKDIVKQALALMDISDFSQGLYTRLSGGEKQRVQLARVMAQIWRQSDAPQRLLLLDEPCAGLDVAHQQQLMQAVKQFANQGVGVIMVLHDFNLAARYANTLLAVKAGKVAACGKPEHVLTVENMKQLFNVNCRIVPHPDTQTPLVLIND